MAELPECLKSVRSRIRSLFGFSPDPAEKNRKSKDEESAGTECGEPFPSGKKKAKTKSGLFNLKSSSSRQKWVTKAERKPCPTPGEIPVSKDERHIADNERSCGVPDNQPYRNAQASGDETLGETFGVPSDDTLRTVDEAMNDTFAKYDTPLTLGENGMIAPNTNGRGYFSTHKDEHFLQGSEKDRNYGPVRSSHSTGDKVKISSVYVEEKNQITFNRTIQSAPGLNTELKKTCDDGNKSEIKSESANQQNFTEGEKKDFQKSQNATSKSDGLRVGLNKGMPMPWDNIEKQLDGEVFVFKGKDTESATLTVSVKGNVSSMGKSFTKARGFDFSCQHPITKDASAQCDLDIYPCTCVIAENGRKIICPLCVDQPVSPKDKVLIARNRDINSPTKQKSKTEDSPEVTRNPTPVCSSLTQTSISGHDTVDQNSNQTRGDNGKVEGRQPMAKSGVSMKNSQSKRVESVQLEVSTRSSSVHQKEKPTRVSPYGHKRANQPVTLRSSEAKPVNTEDPQGKGSGDAGAKAAAKAEVKNTDNVQLNKLERIKNIWKQMKGSKKKPDDCENLLFDLSGDIGDTSDPMADLFLEATAQDLDRIDGITDKDKGLEKKELEGPLTSPAPPNTDPPRTETFQPKGKKTHRTRTRRLPPKENDDTEKEDKQAKDEEPSSEQNDNEDDSFQTADTGCNSITKEDVVAGEKFGFAYSESFELGSYLRFDDQLDQGQKASRGHIPEIKVKQKRRGEPNKHLTGKRRESSELNGDDYGMADSSEGDLGTQFLQDEELRAAETSDTPDTAATNQGTDSVPVIVGDGELVDTSEVVADTRHCDYVALEVLHGKKSDRDIYDMEYQPRSAKKKKGRQRTRDRGKHISRPLIKLI